MMNEMFLSEKEMAVVKSMRKGAITSVTFDGLTEIEEVDERMDLFSDFETTGFNFICQKTDSKGDDYICFLKEMEDVEVTCFIDL